MPFACINQERSSIPSKIWDCGNIKIPVIGLPYILSFG
nr:MAG TPA: hypothetical protein [Caudoviricetes sp.]